jgi:DNA-binding GntR family transcriptional regulator
MNGEGREVDLVGTRESRPPSRPRLARRAGVALYEEVKADLTRRLAAGEFAPGVKLPSEAGLAQDYGVNRLTVRRALADLVRTGVVRTEHGVGTFVREPTVRHQIDDGQVSLSESMAERGLSVIHEVIDVAREPAAPSAPEFPRWPGPTVRFRYRRSLEDSPWSLSEAVLPAVLAPLDWTGAESPFARLTRDTGVVVRRARRSFSADAATAEDARWLEVQAGTPLLVVAGVNTDVEGNDLARIQHRTRADRAEYIVNLPLQAFTPRN